MSNDVAIGDQLVDPSSTIGNEGAIGTSNPAFTFIVLSDLIIFVIETIPLSFYSS